MRLLKLTQVGYGLASNPTSQMTSAMRALYYMKHNGMRATDEQLRDLLGEDYSLTIQKLTSGEAPAVVSARIV